MSEPSFEKSLEKLEDIVSKMEGGELSLDDAMKNYEEGIKLSRFCYKKLGEAEKKIEKLVKKHGADGAESFETETFILPENNEN